MDTVEDLETKLVRCCEELVDCCGIISDLEFTPKNENIFKIGKALAEISELRSVIYEARPDLKPQGWGEASTEDQIAEMFEEANHLAAEYLLDERPQKAIEIYQTYISIGPSSKFEKLAEQKISEIRSMNNL